MAIYKLHIVAINITLCYIFLLGTTMKRIKRNTILTLTIIALISLVGNTAPFDYEICNLGWKHVHHRHNEASYQNVWCSMHNGIEEYENQDFTRVDCLTDKHAVEFDFANKWAESIGQALHYGIMTGKKPKIVLILDDPYKQMIYFKRIQRKEYIQRAVILARSAGIQPKTSTVT